MKKPLSTLWPFGRRSAEGKAPALAWLVHESPGTVGEHAFAIRSSLCRIGRAADNDVCLDDDTVSAHHAEIRQRKDGFFAIEDLNSTNGVTVNSKKVKSRILRPGDLIEIGEIRLRLNH